jgi:hypothetical protein
MSRLKCTGLLVAAVIIDASLSGGAQATTYDLTLVQNGIDVGSAYRRKSKTVPSIA